jgi:hypothetical protein
MWEDPALGLAQQLTWTVLPQGFRDSPHFFGQALVWDLSSLDLQPSTLFQYVDDHLLVAPPLPTLRITLPYYSTFYTKGLLSFTFQGSAFSITG